MNDIDKRTPERREIEDLLPWHAVGTLSRRDAEKVEQALARDPELQRSASLVREELSESIRLNESLGAPSARAMEKLFAAIEAEGSAARRQRMSLDLGGKIAEFLASFSPRTLAWSAAAAGLAIVLQAGLLAGIYVKERGAAYETASRPEASQAVTGSYALVAFKPEASAADITRFLDANKVSIVDGPRSGGLFRVKVAVTTLPKDELAKIVARLAEDTKVVRTALPTE